MMHTELQALVILTSIPLLGPVRIRALIKHFGSALNALHADPSLLINDPQIIENWKKWPHNNFWKRNLELAEQEQIQLLPFFHPAFPKQLLNIPDHPVLLYVKGRLLPSDQRSIAVVGTRQASIYGKEMAERISFELSTAGYTIISGLARGIDTSAHRGALKQGRTVAVIGSGLSRIYPQENHDLAHAITEKGALISEFPMNTPPDRQNFPQRNRIVSGLSMGVLLIEAPIKSGAMITMDKAYTQRKKLFALPGRADIEGFRGNHLLIKNGRATLVENSQDIRTAFEEFPFISKLNSGMTPNLLSPEEREFIAKLPCEEFSFDDIVSILNMPVSKINVILMGLVLKKMIKEYPGKFYRLINN